MNKHVLLVDGMALLFRAFYATAMNNNFMINSKGTPTNAIHGFIRHLLTATNTFQPSHVICCWDMGSHTFRNDLYSEYKANRGAPPEELIPQFDLVKEVTEAMDIPNVGVKGFEADDCIGTLALTYQGEADVTILTGDQDILQLLDDGIRVALLKKGYGNYDVYESDRFLEEKGITPKQMIDLKAMMGDSSDNYPGVRGVGEKTALKLLINHGSLDAILDNLDTLTTAQKTKFENDLEMIHLSRKLAEIHCQAGVTCDLNDAEFNMNRERVIEKFNELEFKRLGEYV
ncbi:5'-3' exonuclease [Alkalibacillus haloalkaliphilus]|uniref:5'-3' exonuclease n=1 Tax=Alkalibacillus haloalkaliphilus TaxID=94136 RepID=UPI002935DA72|nr:5'-3' exonuclease H3TH domain-containing protein [Alkalibacillus haloalkaliphilus]MDV2583070.1 5'-3' exonuclease H3TH domain-containing protein [Alkalibacillus haloalkaliphilus]